MSYQLEWCSWEITRKCNMNCDICLCGGGQEIEGELNTHEALNLCGQIADMGVKRVVLTGGEPLVRDDWDIIATKLTESGVGVQLVTNGSMVDSDMVRRMKKAGINRVTVSVDGTEEVHDQIRTRGSFSKCKSAVIELNHTDIPVFIATTVTNDNYDNLPALKEELKQMGVKNWMLHLGLPYGNFISRDVAVLPSEKIMELIEFCYQTSMENSGLKVYPGDNIGYFSAKEILVRSYVLKTDKIPIFGGCPAGISTLAISHDGTILTISMCIDRFIAGNIRDKSLREIWEDDDNPAWKWRRQLTKNDLKGACRDCEYAWLCLGGCPAVRYSLTGDILGENLMCAYRVAARRV